ncbi:AMIN domain-containing protein, partial [Rhizobiaceae sp. 2RAB30]
MKIGAMKGCGMAIAGSLRAVLSCALVVLFVASVFPPTGAFAEALKATEYKMAGDAARMRVVIRFDREPEPNWFLLRGPHRLVIDLPETNFAIDPQELKARGLVKAIRYGLIGEGKSRLILTGKGPFEVEKLDVVRNESEPGYRLVADIVASSEKRFDEALAAQVETTGSTHSAPKGDRLGFGEAKQGKRFTVVVDPGHGGID